MLTLISLKILKTTFIFKLNLVLQIKNKYKDHLIELFILLNAGRKNKKKK